MFKTSHLRSEQVQLSAVPLYVISCPDNNDSGQLVSIQMPQQQATPVQSMGRLYVVCSVFILHVVCWSSKCMNICISTSV